MTFRRASMVLMAAALAVGVAAPGGAQPVDPVAPPPPEAAEAAEAAACDLRDEKLSPHDEWARCLTVTARLSRAPAQGDTVTLSYDVRAAVPRPGATASVELPEGLEYVELPEGAETTTTALAGGGAGTVTVATSERDLAPRRSERFTTAVRAVGTGPVEIVVRVSAPRPDGGVDAAVDRVFLTLGGRGARSRLGIDTVPVTEAVPGSDPVVEEAVASAPHRPVPEAEAEAEGATPPDALAAVCATGTWTYLDINGAPRVSPNFGVQVWDADTSANELLASGFTDYQGRFNLCYDNTDVDEGGLVDPMVTFVAANSRWRVRADFASNMNYAFETPATQDQAATIDIGTRRPIPTYMRAVRAFDAVNKFWGWKPGTCWDANDATPVCRQVVINWRPTSTDGTYYSTSGNDVHLAAADPDSMHTVIHEATHSVMDDVYEDAYPPIPNCSPHNIWAASSAGCAFTEGFAEWVPASVLKDPFYRWADGSSIPLETPTWTTPGWDLGPMTEGRVAGAMIDLEDAQNEPIWDRWTDDAASRPQWTTFLNGAAQTYAVHFTQERRNLGFSVGESALASLYQNTIDFGYFETLGTYGQLTRPLPTPHNYRYDTTASTWSALAMRPPAGTDYDLELFDGPDQTGMATSSRSRAGVTEYVLVDSHVAARGDYYPRVLFGSGSGSYQIELAQGVDTMPDGSRAWNMAAGDVVHVRDTYLAPGVPTYFRVVPSSGTQDSELFVHTRSAGTTSQYQGRVWAAAAASNHGAGVAESTQITSPVGEWAGLVLINRSGNGTYTIHRDTTAPTGSVVINGGATSTTSQNVTLTMNATDADTGIDGVQISVDGVIDTEPVQAFTATRTVTLPAGAGTKTVLVRYHNRAGMLSQDASDTITLTGGTSAADLRVTALSNPPATRADGTTFSVTDTTTNSGTALAAASATRYHLSLNTTKGTGDVLLTGARSVPQLDGGAASSGSRTVTIPTGTAAGTYYLLACADDRGAVPEANETNNCRASATTVKVT